MNLIPLNPTGGFAGPAAPTGARIDALRGPARGGAACTRTVRRNRGIDIDAACGQLRARERTESHGARSRSAAGSATMVP